MERWDRAKGLLLALAVGLSAGPGLVVGLGNVRDQVRTYAGLRCPPDVVMISPAERFVIEAVRYRTPPTARLLVVSDEHAWFLNYYLYPRRLFGLVQADGTLAAPEPAWASARRVEWVLERLKKTGFRLRPWSGQTP